MLVALCKKMACKQPKPNEWDRDSEFISISFVCKLIICTIFDVAVRIFLCVNFTPLGFDVVPEVKIIDDTLTKFIFKNRIIDIRFKYIRISFNKKCFFNELSSF